jgi:sec-independent protein translocase protein TatB
MFDIGFSEIVVIGVVALVVIGPERLPRTARTLGHLFGRLQRYVNEVKADINREMELDELRRLRTEVQGAASELKESVTRMATEVETGVRSVEQQLNDAGREALAAADATASGEATGQVAAAPGTVPDSSSMSTDPSTSSGHAGASSEPAVVAEIASAGTGGAHDTRQPSLPGFDRI